MIKLSGTLSSQMNINWKPKTIDFAYNRLIIKSLFIIQISIFPSQYFFTCTNMENFSLTVDGHMDDVCKADIFIRLT